jgi:hypothetical protein
MTSLKIYRLKGVEAWRPIDDYGQTFSESRRQFGFQLMVLHMAYGNRSQGWHVKRYIRREYRALALQIPYSDKEERNNFEYG